MGVRDYRRLCTWWNISVSIGCNEIAFFPSNGEEEEEEEGGGRREEEEAEREYAFAQVLKGGGARCLTRET
jgi:hypothetical protein